MTATTQTSYIYLTPFDVEKAKTPPAPITPTQGQVDQLVQARIALYNKAFNDLSANDIVSWQSKDIVYNDPLTDKFFMDRTGSHASFEKNLAAMASLKTIEQSVQGSAEFCTWEMLIEVTYDVDVPELELFKGKKDYIRGVVMLWWRWEGPGHQWDGDLSNTEKGIRGWKIVREHDYMVVMKDSSAGRDVRMF